MFFFFFFVACVCLCISDLLVNESCAAELGVKFSTKHLCEAALVMVIAMNAWIIHTPYIHHHVARSQLVCIAGTDEIYYPSHKDRGNTRLLIQDRPPPPHLQIDHRRRKERDEKGGKVGYGTCTLEHLGLTKHMHCKGFIAVKVSVVGSNKLMGGKETTEGV